jgi:hypothetical protein
VRCLYPFQFLWLQVGFQKPRPFGVFVHRKPCPERSQRIDTHICICVAVCNVLRLITV